MDCISFETNRNSILNLKGDFISCLVSAVILSYIEYSSYSNATKFGEMLGHPRAIIQGNIERVAN